MSFMKHKYITNPLADLLSSEPWRKMKPWEKSRDLWRDLHKYQFFQTFLLGQQFSIIHMDGSLTGSRNRGRGYCVRPPSKPSATSLDLQDSTADPGIPKPMETNDQVPRFPYFWSGAQRSPRRLQRNERAENFGSNASAHRTPLKEGGEQHSGRHGSCEIKWVKRVRRRPTMFSPSLLKDV